MSELVTQQRFEWDKLIVEPLTKTKGQDLTGRQVINFFAIDKDYRKSKDASQVVQKYFSKAKPLDIDAQVIKFGSDHISIEGSYLEMGVCTGRTINFIAALNPTKTIFGFDSFEGLPEDWMRNDFSVPKGTFGYKSSLVLPPVLHNVKLIKGLFKNTLPIFKEKILKNRPIAFLHVDCDIYSSTVDIFSILGENIVDGTIIIFDEFYNYDTYDQHEFKAFHEYLSKSSKRANYLAFNQYFEQVVVRIEG